MAESYEFALQGCSFAALGETTAKILRGELDEASTAFAPSAPELAKLVRAAAERLDRLAKLKALPAPEPLPFTGLALRIAAAKARMKAEGRRKLFSVSSADEALRKMRKCPSGSIYSGILGAAYGPPRDATPSEGDTTQ